jgi:hypothetical protein
MYATCIYKCHVLVVLVLFIIDLFSWYNEWDLNLQWVSTAAVQIFIFCLLIYSLITACWKVQHAHVDSLVYALTCMLCMRYDRQFQCLNVHCILNISTCQKIKMVKAVRCISHWSTRQLFFSFKNRGNFIFTPCEGEDEAVPVHAMKAYWGSMCTAAFGITWSLLA